VCPYIDLRGDEEEIRRKLLDKESVRRKVKRLREQGRLVFRHYDRRDEMQEALPSLLRFYLKRFDARRWLERYAEELRFHRSLLQRMHPAEAVRFSVLELDGRPIAWHFGFAHDGVYHWVRPAFDPAYAESSPGLVMLVHLVEHALSRGYREFDFLRGDEPFKMRWANGTRRVTRFRFFRSRGKRLFSSGSRRLLGWFRRFQRGMAAQT
jgi:CelD/BcsL family acetyltransferase involved in cellulose biosynthesis